MRVSISSAAWRDRLRLGVAVILLLGLGTLGVLRAYELAKSRTVPRTAIGESRWFHYATQSRAAAVLRTLPPAPWEQLQSPEAFGDSEQAWFLGVLRYACPASEVQLDGGDSVHDDVTFSLMPPCVAQFPQYLEASDTQQERGLALGLRVTGWALALLLFGLVGRAVSGGGGQHRTLSELSTQTALEVAVGWACGGLLGVVCFVAGVSPMFGFAALSIASGGVLFARHRKGPAVRASAGYRRLAQASIVETQLAAAIGLGLVGLALAKAWLSPIWSWDHHLIWGFKARQLTAGAKHFLQQSGYEASAPDYPLWLPIASGIGTLGRVPTSLDFHLQWSTAVVLSTVLVWGLLEARRPVERWLTLGLIAASPVFWDMEGLGLAEVPLLVLSLSALLSACRKSRRGLVTILCLMVMVNLKNEGLVLAVALIPCAWLLSRSGGSGSLVRLWPVSTLVAVLASRWLGGLATAPGTPFLGGQPIARAVERVRDPVAVLEPAWRQVVDGSWLGLWVVLPAIAVLLIRSLVRARSRGHLLGRALGQPTRASAGFALWGAVVAVIAVYLAVYFATYLDPEAHIVSSWHRILGPLLVWSLIAFNWVNPSGGAR